MTSRTCKYVFFSYIRRVYVKHMYMVISYRFLVVLVACCLWLLTSFGGATEISLYQLGEYQQLVEQLEEGRAMGMWATLEKRRCIVYDKGTYLAVSPACFLQGTPLPALSLADAVQSMLPYIQDVTHIYDTDADAFWYGGTELLLDDTLTTLQSYQITDDFLLLQRLANHGVLIQIPKVLLAYQQMFEYTFYASVRDTTTYGPCRKQNYDVAMEQLNWLTLVSGEQLNMNTLIADHPDYCEWTMGKYMFYQGVCGGSTQLFWNALVNPYLYVVERHPHSEFRANFYGTMGEDAAIYERSKELILENRGDEELHFATLVRPDGNTVLLSVYPKKEDLKSFIQKQETGGLTADLWNVITDAEGTMQYEQEWSSRYWGVNETSDL